MEYVISFSDVMAGVITVALGVLAYFIKRWFKDSEDRDKTIQDQIVKNDEKVNERIDKLEDKTRNDISKLKQEVNDIKGDFATSFVLREDFFWSMNGVEDRIKSVDGKLDRLLLIQNK